jgi:sterol desaturase/sphingolipid hydroxylase (fatty acid hydroxylase superfamily)
LARALLYLPCEKKHTEKIKMLTRVLLYSTTVLATHHLASLIQASAHWCLGHQKIGGFLHKIHAREHHGIYSEELMISDKYLDEARSADYYYAIPAFTLAWCAYRLLPFDLFLIHFVSLGLSTLAHFYLHVQYHLAGTWLTRYRWFQRKRKLHLLHHRDTTKNYAVIEFFWDRVFGTYEAPSLPAELRP